MNGQLSKWAPKWRAACSISFNAQQLFDVPLLEEDEMVDLLRNHIYAVHAVAAMSSVAVGTAVTYPLDTVKVLIQVGSSSGKKLTFFQALNRVLSVSAVSGLYRGLGWSISGQILGVGARFGVFEIITAYDKDGRDGNWLYVKEAVIAGAAGGILESIISSPFELVKLRAQVSSASRSPSSSAVSENRAFSPLINKLLRGYTPDTKALNYSVGLLSDLPTKHSNLAGALQEYPWMMTGSGRPPSISNVRRLSNIISLEGWHAMWRGLRPGLVRDSVFGGMFFGFWQFLHTPMCHWKAVHMNPVPSLNEDVGPLKPLHVTIAAAFSGSFAAAASHFVDTAKSRAQCTVLPKYITIERKLLKWRRPGKMFERLTGIHPSDRKLLSRGIWQRMARSGTATFIIVGSYYLTVNYLAPS